MTRREVQDLRRAAESPLISTLHFGYHEPSAHALRCIERLADEVLRLQSVLKSRPTTAAASAAKEE